MIALSGCAKRNADRELARVVALVEQRCAEVRAVIAAANGFGVTIEEGMLNALSALRLDLDRLTHRNLAPESRLADQPTEPPR